MARRAAPHNAGWVALLVALVPATSLGLPSDGDVLTEVTVENTDGGRRALPARDRAVLVLYEDKDASAQNQHLRVLLSQAARDQNHAVLDVVAVGDVSAYDFWPAKRFVLDDIRKRQLRDHNTVWLDWKGAVRARWGLTRGKSGVILIDATGHSRFAVEGPLSPAQQERLTTRLTTLGCHLK